MAQPNAYLKTVDRALQVLLQFDEEHPEWSSSELSESLGLHRSIVYRILSTLERRGFVVQNGQRGRFRLGNKLVELGNVVLAGIDLRQIAHPIIVRLARETSESAFLTVASGDESVCIDQVDSPQHIRVTLTIGGRYPLYAGASNKILLAYLPRDVVDDLIAIGLDSITPHTITDVTRLKDDLTAIREQGYAFSVGELTPGVAALAVPLLNSNDTLVAALSIAGLASRFDEDRLPTLIDKTRQAAEEISSQLLAWQVPLVTDDAQA
jgi:IclR family KDG regulon transcriptional repressor